MPSTFQKIPGDGSPWDGTSPCIIRELGRVIDPKEAEECYANALYHIRQKIVRKVLPEDLEPLHVVHGAVHNASLKPDRQGGWHRDPEVGITRIVDGAADRRLSDWPQKLADEIVAAYLGQGPDGTTLGAMKLTKRAASSGGA
jgi:hypothetical protein